MKVLNILKAIWPCIVSGIGGGVMALFAMIVAALGNAAGHGSALPLDMFLAPMGMGIAVWPLTYSLMMVPRRWLPASFAIVAAIIAIHLISAGQLYFENGAEREHLQRIPHELLIGFFVSVMAVELASPVCMMLRAWWGYRREQRRKLPPAARL